MWTRRLVLSGVIFALALPAAAVGATNPQIAGLQAALRARGLYLAPIDGIAGPKTVRAVRTFQRREGLAVDGIAGPRTRRELGRLGSPLFGRRTLRLRMVGWDVAALQFVLTRKGAPTGYVDGYFGRETAAAVRRYQRRAGVAVDGIVGPATFRALGSGRRWPASPRVRATQASVRAALVRWARYYGLDPRLVRALAWVESGNQPNVTSPAGAWGVMQVMPSTWRFVEEFLLGRNVPRTANGNIRVGVAYLHHLWHRFEERPRLALAAYYQGPAAVRRSGLFRATRAFVRTVLAVRQRI
jgi:peptidoglycan hydrolase-like protein with peptidoglycan-binding domain